MGTSYAVEGSAKNTVVNPYCHSLRRMAAATSRRHNRNAWLVTVLTLPRPVSRLPTSGRTEPRITAPNERVIAGSASSLAGHGLSLCRQHSPLTPTSPCVAVTRTLPKCVLPHRATVRSGGRRRPGGGVPAWAAASPACLTCDDTEGDVFQRWSSPAPSSRHRRRVSPAAAADGLKSCADGH
jgi:hypothetical protein